jgi:carbonic anhydrase
MSIMDAALSANATIGNEVPVRGFVYDVRTGRLSEVFPGEATAAGQ